MPAVRERNPGSPLLPCPMISAPPEKSDDSRRPVRPAPKHRVRGPPLPFGAMLLRAASTEACPPPHYRHCAPLIHIIRILAYLITDGKGCQHPAEKYIEKTGGLYVRRLPAKSFTTPLMKRGSRIHTILTRMLSPPACRNERPARAHQGDSRQRGPRPSRDAQEEQQQSRADEHAAQQPPEAFVHRAAALLPFWGLIPDSHG